MTDRSVRFAFVSGALLLVVWTVLWIAKDNVREWIPYQQAYAAALKKQGFSGATPHGIQQVVIEELNRIDRCPTCHLGVTNPLMRGARHPLAYHDGSETHPPDRFGCVVCHGGQGLATTMKDAHGRVPFWNEPLREGDALEWVCGNCHLGTEIAGAPRLSEGRRLYAQYGCDGCHKLRGQGGDNGPELTEVGLRRTDPEWHVAHLLDPQAVVPGSEMRKLGLSDTEARALAFYMLSLRGAVTAPSDYLVLGPGRGAIAAAEGTALAAGGAEAKPSPTLVGSRRCNACHGVKHSECAEPSLRDCESCHGPGSEFIRVMASTVAGKKGGTRALRLAAGLRLPGRAVCARCHEQRGVEATPPARPATDTQTLVDTQVIAVTPATPVGRETCIMCHADPQPHAACAVISRWECENCHGYGSRFVEVMQDNGGTPERRFAAGLTILPRGLCDGCHAQAGTAAPTPPPDPPR